MLLRIPRYNAVLRLSLVVSMTLVVIGAYAQNPPTLQTQKPLLHQYRSHQQSTETRLSIIHSDLQANRTAEALRLASQLSVGNQNDVQLHLSLGVLLASERQYKAAQLELERADALQPGSFAILFNLGQATLRSGDNAAADQALSQALKLQPESPEALYLLAEVYKNELRPLDALDLLVRANKLAPANVDILFLMAQISISQKYYEDAIPLLEKGLQIDPKRDDLRSALGESYFESGRFDKSIKEFEQVILEHPSARAYALLGLVHTHLGRLDDARADFANGLKLDPHNPFCMFHLGYVAELQGNSTAAEAAILKVLRSDPNYPDALLELANIRIAKKDFAGAQAPLLTYVRVSSSPATGYYKLAMVERALHQQAAAERDLAKFQLLSTAAPIASHPYEHLFDYLDNRSRLDPKAQAQQDSATLLKQAKLHPHQPEVLYALAEAYLKSGDIASARNTIAELNKAKSGDSRVLTGAGVLLARYGLYDDAILNFQAALAAAPSSDDANFDLADAYFHKGMYPDALNAATKVSEQGRTDDSYLSLLADIYAHMGDRSRAEEIYHSAIERNPDNDQDYLSLALLEFHENKIPEAKQTLLQGQARVPGSGKLLWGLGLVSALEGNTSAAAAQFKRAVDLMPEWPGAYSTLGVFYYETGQISDAREVLDRFKNSGARGGLDINRIQQVLAQAPAGPSTANEPLSSEKKAQLLQFALYLADKTM